MYLFDLKKCETFTSNTICNINVSEPYHIRQKSNI